eukprot:UN02063
MKNGKITPKTYFQAAYMDGDFWNIFNSMSRFVEASLNFRFIYKCCIKYFERKKTSPDNGKSELRKRYYCTTHGTNRHVILPPSGVGPTPYLGGRGY